MQTYSLIFDGDHGNTREIAKINALTDDGRSKPESGILDEPPSAPSAILKSITPAYGLRTAPPSSMWAATLSFSVSNLP